MNAIKQLYYLLTSQIDELSKDLENESMRR